MQDALGKRGYAIESAELAMVPKNTVKVEGPDADRVLKLMNRRYTFGHHGAIGRSWLRFQITALYGALQGMTLSLRPAVVEDSPIVPVAWICGFAPAPEKMTVMGSNRTNLPKGWLPVNCL